MDIKAAVAQGMGTAKAELGELVAFASVADARQFPKAGCDAAAAWVRDAFAAAGIDGVTLEETSDGSLAVIGHTPAPPGAPTVTLYSHYDVQPPLDEDAWDSPPFELTERGGRWYGRGAADCKGNIVAHLVALRALAATRADQDHPFGVGVRIMIEGSEEQGGGGLEDYVRATAGSLASDAIVIADSGNAEIGLPTATTALRGMANVIVTIETMSSVLHSGSFGGPTPDALSALIALLATLKDEHGNTTVDGLDSHGSWDGLPYEADRFRRDAGLIDGVELLGDSSVADMLWARPAITVLGIDAPPVVGSAAALQPKAAARLNLRVPPGVDETAAQDALVAHLEAHTPWGARVTVERESLGAPFKADTSGPAYAAMGAAMRESYGRDMVTQGNGGSIPLCTVLHETYPDAEIILIGVEEPSCRIHAPNESVDPSEIEHIALAEALFLAGLAVD